MNDRDKHLAKLKLSDIKRYNRSLKRAVAKEEKRLAKIRTLDDENLELSHKLGQLRDAKRREPHPFG